MELKILQETVELLLQGEREAARGQLIGDDPFMSVEPQGRRYSETEKMRVFFRDGFVDRYSGKRLLNPGILRCITYFFPEEFPYHPHWKMSQCHLAYWELFPTIDHIVPVARGGQDVPENWVTTSMLNNSIKANWTLEELRWELCAGGALTEWDGLTKQFLSLSEAVPELLTETYIRRWYHASRAAMRRAGDTD